MRIRDIWIGLILITVIFFSYYSLNLIVHLTPITKNNYSLKTHNITKENTSSSFRKEKNGTFFIHPGNNKASVGVFTFHDSYDLALDFWIKKGSTIGNVEFNITKNGIPIKSLIVTPKDKQQLSIIVEKDDELRIEADKHGVTSQDWSQMKIGIQEKFLLLKNFIIPFSWSIFLIFLLGKRYTCIAIVAYLLFTLMIFSEKLNFGFLSFQNLLSYTIIMFYLTFIFIFIYQGLRKFKKYKIATIFSFIIAFLIYIIPLFFIIYALNFDHKVTKDILFAIFQSNSKESHEYISDFISSKYIIFFIFFTSLIAYLLYRQEKKETIMIEKSLLIFIIVTFFSILLTQFSQLRLLNFFIDNIHIYSKELHLFKYTQEKRKTGKIKFTATKKPKGETYIFIIGESLNRKHMGLYGYLRHTTPKLSKMARNGELIVFTNAYSNHTHTVPVLSLALTEANQYNKKKYYNSLSIIDILKKANIETYWLTNQTIYGAWDNMVSVIGTSADYLVALNKHIGKQTHTDKFDGALIDEVKKVLSKKTDKNRVIFIHLIGNHGTYASRYPHKTYSIYDGILKKGEFGSKASKVTVINDYDNSVVYNDYVVSSIFKEAQKNKSILNVMYMSDHTDDVIDKLGHNSSDFTFYMTQIPIISWFSNTFKDRYYKKYQNLIQHTNRLYSNDMLYDTLIGIFGIKTDKYNPKYDLSSDKYILDPKDALTLHGEKHYTDKNNHIYWQKINTRYLTDTNQSSRIFPYRVDSIGKLKDIWNDGFRSFELDVRFLDDNKSNFIVEYNNGEGDVKLNNFISSIDYTKIQHLWLNFKNLNKSNVNEAFKQLEYLNNKYLIKNKLIISSGTTGTFFNHFSAAGWHISYYLETKKIVKLLDRKNDKDMNELAKSIAMQTKVQGLSAISFDYRLYPFVKKYLEPLITKNIIYHISYTLALFDTHFKKKLEKKKLYQDVRVKTLSVPYDSQFNL